MLSNKADPLIIIKWISCMRPVFITHCRFFSINSEGALERNIVTISGQTAHEQQEHPVLKWREATQCDHRAPDSVLFTNHTSTELNALGSLYLKVSTSLSQSLLGTLHTHICVCNIQQRLAFEIRHFLCQGTEQPSVIWLPLLSHSAERLRLILSLVRTQLLHCFWEHGSDPISLFNRSILHKARLNCGFSDALTTNPSHPGLESRKRSRDMR